MPGLYATLLSTIKAMLQKQSIRIYMNDELRLVLPNDSRVRPPRDHSKVQRQARFSYLHVHRAE
eukprot:6194699-Pleurochrysis_carterae.AAC.3